MDLLDSVFGPSEGDYDSIYDSVGKKYNLDPRLLKAQNMQEVGPHGGVTTAANAEHSGLGQLGPAVRKQYGVTDTTDPSQTIDAQAHYMRDMIDRAAASGNPDPLSQGLRLYEGGPNEAKWGTNNASYPGAVLAHYKALGGDPASFAYGGQPGANAVHPDELLDAVFKPEPGAAPAASLTAGAAAPNWNQGRDIGNKFLLGAGSTLAAAGHTAGQLASDLYNGMPLKSALGDIGPNFSYAKQNENLSSDQWQKDNPRAALFDSIVGAGVPTTAAIASGDAALLQPAANAIREAAPAARPLVNLLTGAVGKAAPGAAASLAEGTGGLLARSASRLVPGAVAGGTAGLVQSGLSNKPVGDQIATGAEFGGLANPVLSSALEPLAGAVAPTVARAAQTLGDLGVNIRAGQLPGAAPLLRLLDSTMGKGGNGAQRSALTQAVSRTFGEDSPVIDKDLLNGAESRLNGVFQNFAKNTTLQTPAQYHQGVNEILAEAHTDPIPDQKLAQLREAAGLMKSAGAEGTMSGKDYLALTKRGSALDRLQRDPDIGQYAQQLRDHLDDTLEDSVRGAAGRWVDGTEAAAGPLNRLALPAPQSQNLLGVGEPDTIRMPEDTRNAPLNSMSLVPFEKGGTFAQPMPLASSVESGPLGRGKVWEIDPKMQSALDDLRLARAQWRNLKAVGPAVDEVSGQVTPSKLASQVARFYKRSNKAQDPTGQGAAIQALAGASHFLPNAEANAPSGVMSLLHSIKGSSGGLAGGALALAGEKALEHLDILPTSPTEYLYGLLGGGLGYGAGKAAQAAAGSRANTARIINNALGRRQPIVSPSVANMLLPPGVQMSNYDPERPQP